MSQHRAKAQLFKWRIIALTAIVPAISTGGCAGWKKPEPDQSHLKEVNTLFQDRYSDTLDVLKLIKTDPRAAVRGPKGELTSEEAIRLALTHNLSLITQSESLPVAQSNLIQAGLLPNPTIGQTSAFYFPVFGGNAGATAFDIFVSDTINDFWTTPRKVAIAKAQRFQAGIDMSTTAFNLAQQTQQQYQQLAFLSRNSTLQRQIAQTYKQAMDESKAMLKTGLVTRSDFNRAVIAYEDNLRQAHHYDTQFDGAARQLNWLMGAQGPVEWNLPGSIQDPPKVLAALPNQERLEQLAVKYRLDLMRANFDREIAKIGVELAKLGYIPQITLGFDAARDSSKNWTGGPDFNTVLPIFDPGIVAFWTATYQQVQTEYAYVTLEGQCKQDVRNALNALQVAAEDVVFSRDITIPQEEENIKQAELSYKLGNSQLDDYLNSIREYVGVLQNYEEEIQAYNQAIIGLETAVGLSFKRIDELSADATPKPTTGANVPGLKINPMGITGPATLPKDWQTPHRPFNLDPLTKPAATQPDGAIWPYEIVPHHKEFRIWEDETRPTTGPAPATLHGQTNPTAPIAPTTQPAAEESK